MTENLSAETERIQRAAQASVAAVLAGTVSGSSEKLTVTPNLPPKRIIPARSPRESSGPRKWECRRYRDCPVVDGPFMGFWVIDWFMGDMVDQRLPDLTPSAKLIFTVLEHEGKLTQKQIVEETLLPARTARSGLNQLKEIEIIGEEQYLLDARQSVYVISEQ